MLQCCFQMVCDAQRRITSCVATSPGSVHDSRVFRRSGLCRLFETGVHSGFLLGDSGYPCRTFLMTPFLNPSTQAEENFNMSLCVTRVLVEQTFGILKRRFACLHNELRTSPEQAIVYITACAVLHNLGIERGEIMNLDQLDRFDEHEGPLNNVIVRQDGSSTRKRLVDTFFS